jgi:hypothetical protein
MKPRRLHVAGAFIMVAWFVSLGWLVKRQYFSGDLPAGVSAEDRVAPGSFFFAVFSHGQQVGTASLSADTLPDGVRVTSRLDLGRGDQRLSQLENFELTPSLTLRRWSARSSGPREDVTVTALRDPAGLLKVMLGDSGHQGRTRRLDPGLALPLLAQGLRATVHRTLRTGDTLTFLVLDPMAAEVRPVRLAVLPSRPFHIADSARYGSDGRWTEALTDTVRTRVLVGVDPAAPMRLWLDFLGYPVRVEFPDSLVYERTTFEIANLNYRNGYPLRSERWSRPPAGPMPADSVAPGDTASSLIFPALDSILEGTAAAVLAHAATRADSINAAARWVARSIARGGAEDDAIATLTARRGTDTGRLRLLVSLLRRAGIPARLALLRQGDDPAPAFAAQAWDGQWLTADLRRGHAAADTSAAVLLRRVNGFQIEQAGFTTPADSAS